jgi:hypothetical protein
VRLNHRIGDTYSSLKRTDELFGGPSSIDDKRRSRHESRRVAGEENNRAHQVLEVPSRPIRDRTSILNSTFSKNGAVIGVSMNVGQSVLTRMRSGASSITMARLNPSIAHWLAQ